MGRELATIQKIRELHLIENAEALELATVLGWKVVVKKGEFNVGDSCVYCEIDSILPQLPEFEFLRQRKFRIKTVKLRGQISQGICFPLSILDDKKFPDDERENPTYELNEGKNVTALLGVEQYLPPIPPQLMGIVKGHFPSFIPKTDETRVQVIIDELKKYEGTLCYITEKIDGSSVTFYLKDGVFGVCSRNLELVESGENAIWKWARENKLEEKIRSLKYNVSLQGEYFGFGINKNALGIKENKILFFNVFKIDEYQYCSYFDFIDVIKALGLETVPIIATDYQLNTNIDALVELAVQKSLINKNALAEGIVIRPLNEISDAKIGRLSFKVINPEYLLSIGE